ncbi:MAG: hypothetical protein KC620_24090, partial [Myxococcales bacterium]|nr:hypothetical protein [Myxococcales bacterium]
MAIRAASARGLERGDLVERLDIDSGPGNFSELSWTGAHDAPTLAVSLMAPGNSTTYNNPDDPEDHRPDVHDWVFGSPGVSNARAVRAAMDTLLGEPIVVVEWSEQQGQGGTLKYRIDRFLVIRLTDYQLGGRGFLSFVFEGQTACYNEAPVAEGRPITLREDTPTAITLRGDDIDGDPLTFTVVTQPLHGALSG